MNSWAFPRLFTSNRVKLEEDKQSVTTQFKLLINSELYEMRYDPGYGSNVPLLKYRPANQLTKDLLTDAIYDAQIFCPNIVYARDQIEIKKVAPAEYEATISAKIDLQNYITNIQVIIDATTE